MRDEQLDIYRALVMIYMVTLIHSLYWLSIPFDHPATSLLLIEMPLIFFISGASYHLSYRPSRSYTQYIWSRIKRVYIPYLVWALINILVFGIIGYAKGDYSAFLEIKRYASVLTCRNPDLIPFAYHLWFLPVFLPICFLAPLFYSVCMKGKRQFVCLLVFFLLVTILMDGMEITSLSAITPFIRKIVVYSFFFCLGFCYKRVSASKCYYVAAFCCAAVFVLYATGVYGMNMQSNKFPPNIMFLLYGTCALSAVCIVCSKVKFKSNKFIDFYNKRGYTIYLYQNIGFFIAYLTIAPLFWEAESVMFKISITVLLFVYLFFAHAFVAYFAGKAENWVIKK